MAEDKKSMALLLGMPKVSEEPEDEEMDMGADRRKAAARAFIDAVKADDEDGLSSAFEELCDAHGYGSNDEE